MPNDKQLYLARYSYVLEGGGAADAALKLVWAEDRGEIERKLLEHLHSTSGGCVEELDIDWDATAVAI